MDDEGVGQLLDRHALSKLNSLVAALALIIADYFSGNIFLQAFVQSLLIFDFQGEIVKIFDVLLQISTILASHDGADLTPKNILKKILLTCIFKELFKSIKAKVHKLLGVLLLSDIRWHTIEGLITEAKRCWIVILPIRELQKSK